MQVLTLMIRFQVRKQSFIAMADEVTICSMMADIIRWYCGGFDPEAQRTVPLRSQQPSQPDQYQMLREEVEQQQERLSNLRLTTQTLTMSLKIYMSALMQLSFTSAFLKAGFHYDALCTLVIETI